MHCLSRSILVGVTGLEPALPTAVESLLSVGRRLSPSKGFFGRIGFAKTLRWTVFACLPLIPNGSGLQEAVGSSPNAQAKQRGDASHPLSALVGVTGLEPAASWSRTKRTTKLCHTPLFQPCKYSTFHLFCQVFFGKKSLGRILKSFSEKSKKGY